MARKQISKTKLCAILLLGSGLSWTGIAEARACHIYSKWHYPYRQRCFTAYAPVKAPVIGIKPASRVPETSHERIEIIIPPLEWVPCPLADDRLTGIAKLRALGNGL